MTETPTPQPASTPTTHHPYGTPDTPHVTVRGEAHLEVDPELAHITITLTARGTDRRTTLDGLTHRNTTTLDLIKSYGDTIEKLETGTLTINPELTRHGRAERIRAYHGHIQLTATINDFTTLGELITRLADHDLTRIDGPWWSLRPTSPTTPPHAAKPSAKPSNAPANTPKPSTPASAPSSNSATPAPTTHPSAAPPSPNRCPTPLPQAEPKPPTPPRSTSNPYARPSTPRSRPPSPSSRRSSDKRSSERTAAQFNTCQ